MSGITPARIATLNAALGNPAAVFDGGVVRELIDEIERLCQERTEYEAAIEDAHAALTAAGCPLDAEEATVDGRIYALHPEVIDDESHLPRRPEDGGTPA